MKKIVTVNVGTVTVGQQNDETVLLPEMVEMNKNQVEIFDENSIYKEIGQEEYDQIGIDWEKYDFLSFANRENLEFYSWKKEWLTFQ